MSEFAHIFFVTSATSPYISGYKVSDKSAPVLRSVVGADGTYQARYTAAISRDGNWMFLGGVGTPQANLFRRQGDTWVPVADATPGGGGIINTSCFSEDGQFIGAGRQTQGPLFYKREGSTLTPITPTGTGLSAINAMRSWGDYFYAGSSVSNMRAVVFKRTGDAIARLVALDTVGSLGTNNVLALLPSPDGNWVFAVTATSIFRWGRAGDTFTGGINLNIAHGVNAQGAAFSPDGKYLAIVGNTAPYLAICKHNGSGTLTLLSNPLSAAPAGQGRDVAFSDDSAFLCMAETLTPFIETYSINTTTDAFTKAASPMVLPYGTGAGLAISPYYFAGKTSPYTSAMPDILNGTIKLNSLKAMLLSPTAAFDPNHTTISAVNGSGAREVYGNGWPQGGIVLPTASYAAEPPYGVKLVMAAAYANATSGVIEADRAVIYDSSNGKPLVFIDFEAKRSAETGKRFGFNFSNGLILFQKK